MNKFAKVMHCTYDLMLVSLGIGLCVDMAHSDYKSGKSIRNSCQASHQSSQGVESLISENPRYIYALTNERPTNIPQNDYVYIPREAIICREEDLRVSPVVKEEDSIDSIIFPITRLQDPTIIDNMHICQIPQPKFNYVPKFLSTMISRARPPYHLRI